MRFIFIFAAVAILGGCHTSRHGGFSLLSVNAPLLTTPSKSTSMPLDEIHTNTGVFYITNQGDRKVLLDLRRYNTNTFSRPFLYRVSLRQDGTANMRLEVIVSGRIQPRLFVERLATGEKNADEKVHRPCADVAVRYGEILFLRKPGSCPTAVGFYQLIR